jgi:hypothetical protein
LKFSLKINQIFIYREEHIDSDEVYPQIGIALKLSLSDEIEPLLVDQLLMCAGKDYEERMGTSDELFNKCR